MKIIAIDPGYDRCGVAIIETSQPPQIFYSTCITTNKAAPHGARLVTIYRALEILIEKYVPDTLALETIFFSINKKTAIKVAEARGVIVLLAGMHKLPLIELSPQEVKLSMTGIGNASKEQVKKMVLLTHKLDKTKKFDDETDAIALGVAAAQRLRVENLKKGLAKKK